MWIISIPSPQLSPSWRQVTRSPTVLPWQRPRFRRLSSGGPGRACPGPAARLPAGARKSLVLVNGTE
jgi:hypothetical protein